MPTKPIHGSQGKQLKCLDATAVTDAHLRQRLTQQRPSWKTVGPPPTPDDIAYARILLTDPCSYCGGPAGMIEHVDHHQHGWNNLTATCHACNISKGKHTLIRHILARRLRQDREHITAQIRALGEPHGPRSHQPTNTG